MISPKSRTGHAIKVNKKSLDIGFSLSLKVMKSSIQVMPKTPTISQKGVYHALDCMQEELTNYKFFISPIRSCNTFLASPNNMEVLG